MVIKDDKGNIINTFDSKAECPRYLGVSPTTVANVISTGKSILFENKFRYINKIIK